MRASAAIPIISADELASNMFPGELPQLRSAAPAKPAFEPLGPAIALERFAACATSLPGAGGHPCLAAAPRDGADFKALLLPGGAVAVLLSHQGVSDLVQQGVQDLGCAVAVDEAQGKLDAPPPVH